MKILLHFILLLVLHPLFSQGINTEEFYPKLKKTDQRFVKFKGCVSGNCRSGEGVYMTISTPTSGTKNGTSFKKSTIYLYRGTFYKNGLKLIGKEFGIVITYDYKNAKSKTMTPSYTNMMDGSDATFESTYINYEGEFKLSKQEYVRNGKKGIMHYSLNEDKKLKSYTCDYYNGYKNKRYITYVDGYKFKSYEGWVQLGERMTVGKLVLANGDMYEGTFFDDKYEGLGRLTTSSGVKEGYWKNGVLVKEKKLTLPNEAFTGVIDFTDRLWIKVALYDTEKEGSYYGVSSDKVPNGQGLFFNYWGNIVAGNFTEGKLNGYGYRLTTETQVKYHKSDHYPHTKEIGVFKDGKLVDGERIKYKLQSTGSGAYTYSITSTKLIAPSSAVVAQKASVTEVTLASNDVDKQYQQAIELMNKYEYSKALFILEKIIPQRGYDNQLPMQAAFCYLMLKDINKAEKYINQSLIVNKTDFTGYLVDSYIKTAKNEMAAAKSAMDDAMWFDPNTDETVLTTNLIAMGEAGLNSAGCDEMLAYIKANYVSRDMSYKVINDYMDKGSQQVASNPSIAKINFDKGIKASAVVSQKPWLKAYAYYVAGANFYYGGKYSDAKDYLDKAYTENQKYQSSVSPYVQLFTNVILAEYAANASNLDKVKGYLNKASSQINQVGAYANDLKAKYYESWCNVHNKLNEYKSVISKANTLKSLKNTGYDLYYEAKALNYLGMGYGLTGTAEGRKTSRKYYEEALRLSEANGFTDLEESIEANLPIAYWQAGEKQKAITLYDKSIQKSSTAKNFKGAETSANNLAYLFVLSKDYASAVKYFKQAIELTEKARLSFKGEGRVTYLQGKTSAYQGLIYCLAKLNRVEEVFEAQQKDRARILIENLSKESKAKEVSLSTFQSTLSPTETAVFYSLYEAGTVVITTVSKTSASVDFIDQKTEFFNLKSNYLELVYKGKPGYNAINIEQAKNFANVEDKIASQFKNNDFNLMMELLRGVIDKSIETPNESVRAKIIDDLMHQYYSFLIQPIENKLTGKNQVILFPDGILNFLPFEAVRPYNGAYFVEKYDVRYGRSAGVSDLLRGRKYAANRKSFLAMGGALYGRMNEHDKVDKENIDYVSLKAKAVLNAEQGKSQREIYASLFGEKMNYLKGTLVEVNNLSQIFENPLVYRSEEMTENKIKSLSKTKELQNYKIIHLATHGFSLPEFPELSGVAMCIFPEMQNGEDGYLTVPEIAQLDMKADMVVLSACETALGKIYGGEGVAGLTQAILEGGANAAMVSLWPVNDAGTMYFMTGLYELTEKEGKTYVEAVNIMKRKFISGEFGASFKDPQIWAPFIHYGY